jgi:hypothetical protein
MGAQILVFWGSIRSFWRVLPIEGVCLFFVLGA